MERLLLAISTFSFLFGFAYTMYALGARAYRHTRFNFFANLFGFVCQTGFLYVRGQQVGRCPLTSLFDVLVFLCWSMVFFYLVIGPAYRLSLLGAFTAPLVCMLQIVALLLPSTPARVATGPVSAWLELHAALSVVAYGAFALACVAGLMYLVQERQLKTHHLQSIFYHLPPIHDLAIANRRLIMAGFALFTAGVLCGVMQGIAHIQLLWVITIAVWVVYAAILAAVLWHRISPRRVALLSVSAFSVMLLTLWAIQLVPARP